MPPTQTRMSLQLSFPFIDPASRLLPNVLPFPVIPSFLPVTHPERHLPFFYAFPLTVPEIGQ